MKLFASLLSVLTAFSALAEPIVTSATAKQRFPWNGLVDITCTISGFDGTYGLREIAMAAVDPSTGVARNVSQVWLVRGAANSADLTVQEDGIYHLVWDARADLGRVRIANMVMRIALERRKVQLWEGGPYWAETNIGAEEPEEYGLYFWWGDTIGYRKEGNTLVGSDGSTFNSQNTPTQNKEPYTLRNEGWITADGVLALAHDAAHVHWGETWRMPTLQEIRALRSNCDWTRTTLNGVNGYAVCGRGDYAFTSIFLPATYAGKNGYYWSSNPCTDSSSSRESSFCFFFDYVNVDWDWYAHYNLELKPYVRHMLNSVRPIQGFNNAAMAANAVDTAPFLLDLGYIRNVTARQLWPHKKVEVCYEIADDIGDVLDGDEDAPSITAGYNGTMAFTKTLLGDNSWTPGLHRVVWDMEADGIAVNTDAMSFEVASEATVPGFVTKTFSSPSLVFDKTSDVWSGNPQVVSSPDKIYAKFLAEHTTVAYGCYMKMTAGVKYEFKGYYDDYVGVKIESNWIMQGDGERTGSFTPPSSGWYKVEFRVGNDGGPGGLYSSSQYGIKWRSSANTTWRNIANSSSEAIFFAQTKGSVVGGASGLSVKYYDISSSGYSTWTQSEAAMTNYFASRTPTIEASTSDWGQELTSGFVNSSLDSYYENRRIDAGLAPLETDTCRFHGKYASGNQNYFALSMEGYLHIDIDGNYSFGVLADDHIVVYVDGKKVCSAQWENYGVGSRQLTAGKHRISVAHYENSGGQGLSVQWKKPGDSSYAPIPQALLSMESTIAGTSLAIPVNTSSSVKDGMSVAGTVELGYSPFTNGEVSVEIDGVAAFSSTNSGTFAWQPLTAGSHTLKHTSGSTTWTRRVNVTSLAGAAPAAPNPPTAADANISIGTTTKAFGVEGGSSSITTAGSGTWSATASESWITIPSAMASRNAGLPVVYQVAASTEVEPRTGYIYVSGHVFTVTQAGVGAELDRNSAGFETEGGKGSFTVLAGAQSSWKVKSNVDWISVTTTSDDEGAVATAGTGEGVVRFTVAPWNEVSTRSGTITAAGCTFTVNQTGRPMKISGPDITSGISGLSASFNYQSHVLPIIVNALASTECDVEVDASWLSVVDGGGGHGGGNVSIAINENPSWLARVGTVRIGTETLTVNQAGRPPSALSFLISPSEATATVKGANAIIAVSATPDLPWTATSRANWLTIMPEVQKGAGNGNVVYSASPNPTMAARTGTIQLAAATGAGLPVKTHTVTQPAATAMISTGSHTFDAAGESFAVDVAVDDVVGWSVAESCDWLSVAGTTNRVGAGSVSLVAMENPTVDPRSATVTIAGHAFVATQRGRTVEVEYEERVFGSEGGYDSLDVHPEGNAVWTAEPSDPSWITLWGDEGCEYDDYGNVIGMGDATIGYIVSEYVGDGTPRTAAISIGDQTIYITQREYDLSIDPSATRVGGNAGAGEIGVSAPLNAIWNAIATDPWFTIVSGTDSGTGGGKVLYTYTDNDTGEERTGKIIISGEAYTITQERRMVSVSARVEGGGGHVGGTGTYYVGSPVTLTATAEDGYEFVRWTLPDGSVATSATLPVVADVDKEVVASFRRIPVHDVNGETVLAGTSMTFTAPAPILDAAGTIKLVCAGTSRFPEKGASFTLVVTGDIAFEWDLWTTNYLVTVEQTPGGQVRDGGDAVATSAWLPAGSILNLTAVPDAGNSFFRWVVNGETLPTCSTRSTRLKITAPLTVSAIFGVFDDTLAAALDAPALAFTTGGDAEWLPVIDASAQTGFTSARSGAIGAESETWLDTTVTGAGTLTFRWRVDCEKDDGGGSTWDRLSVWVNGVEAARLDGTTDWQMVTLPIPAPKTTIRWSFYRDDWDEPDARHENAAWVDGVTFTKEGE